MSVLGGALPSRILVVDDDELELAHIRDRLTSANYSVTAATNGEEALRLLEQQWFPLVITDWQMPVMDGIQFTEALRARGNDETYVIMLTMREGDVDYERGYRSGVNDYLTKRLPDPDLFARINVAFNTLALRRSLAHAQDALAAANPLDAETGAFTMKELHSRLHAELVRAQRYGRMVSVLTVGVRSTDPERKPDAQALKSIARTIQSTVRAHVDAVGRVQSEDGEVFAIVLAEAGTAQVVPVHWRLRDALMHLLADELQSTALSVDFGAASFQRIEDGQRMLAASDLVELADRCRDCPGFRCPQQLSAVQYSVETGGAIVCRNGYAVEEYCALKTRSR